jgi:hypothetical protein
MSRSGTGILHYSCTILLFSSLCRLIFTFSSTLRGQKERSGTGSRKEEKGKAENRSDFSVFSLHLFVTDRLCGLVVRVPGYRSKGPGFDSLRCQIF